MLMKVVVENGVKKLVPLTADAGSGNPCGTIIAIYSNQVPYGYLPCNGVQFDTAQFPVLYALLGDDHTPDLRECVLVGSGQSGRTILDESGHNHDVYTVGQFKDDQLQDHTHLGMRNDYPNGLYAMASGNNGTANTSSPNTGRTGTTTHGKQVGVNFCIKATSGINENQADNVLSALTPVNEVALNNLHSVTSNAVAVELNTVANELALRLKTYEQPWGAPHSYTLVPDSTYILFCQSPNVLATDIWLIKSRHSTIASLTGYCQIIMKGTYSPDYNIGITGDTLTIDVECVTSLIKINLVYG